jgi:hypothetical protein
MSFQNSVNIYNPLAVNGDFASANPRASFVGVEGGYVAGTGGVTVGRFVWIQSDGVTVLNTGTGAPDGFVHREQQALITTYLADSGNVVPAGFPITIMRTGDYYATATVGGATKGQKAFAKLADGTVQAANAGATVSGFVETSFVVERTVSVGELTVITF